MVRFIQYYIANLVMAINLQTASKISDFAIDSATIAEDSESKPTVVG